MASKADLVAFGPQGDPALVVEVKSIREADAAWAAKMRRNLAVHGGLSPARFFLLALPDRFYLWKDNVDSTDEVAPAYAIDPSELLRPYFEKACLSPETVSSEAFELLVANWLDNLLEQEPTDASQKAGQWVSESGLLDQLKGGRIEYEVSP